MGQKEVEWWLSSCLIIDGYNACCYFAIDSYIVLCLLVFVAKKKRITFLECNNDLNSMIDVAKTADLVFFCCFPVMCNK